MIQAMRDLLIKNQGHIINISSVAGHGTPPDFGGLYGMSKFAMETMSETLRLELRDFGVQVTTVNPGWYKTQILKKINDALNEMANKTVYYKGAVGLEKIGALDPNIGRDVSIIGEDVLKIVNSDNPPTRFVSGDNEQKNRMYDTMVERLRDVLKSSTKTLEEFLIEEE